MEVRSGEFPARALGRIEPGLIHVHPDVFAPLAMGTGALFRFSAAAGGSGTELGGFKPFQAGAV
jgi:hypothetical protein